MDTKNKINPETELKNAENNIKSLLLSLINSDRYLSFNPNGSPREEMRVFRAADLNGKSALMNNYTEKYRDVNLTPEERGFLTSANRSILLAKSVSLDLPVSFQSLSSHSSQLRPHQHYDDALPYIKLLQGTKNLNKCEHRDKPLINYIYWIQANPSKCTQRDCNNLKIALENLERYNEALKLIDDLEKKAFPVMYKQDIACKIAETLKEGKGRCSESQLKQIQRAHKALIISAGKQEDFESLHRNKNKSLKKGIGELDR